MKVTYMKSPNNEGDQAQMDITFNQTKLPAQGLGYI